MIGLPAESFTGLPSPSTNTAVPPAASGAEPVISLSSVATNLLSSLSFVNVGAGGAVLSSASTPAFGEVLPAPSVASAVKVSPLVFGVFSSASNAPVSGSAVALPI